MQEKIVSLIKSKTFEYSILIVILINTVVIAADTIYNVSSNTEKLLYNVDLVCIGIFVIEAIFKNSCTTAKLF